MNCLVVKKIRKKIKGYLKNITDNEYEEIEENAILTKNKLSYIKDSVKHTILYKENEILLIRESSDFKNILTFSKKRIILSEYIVKENNLCINLEIETLELEYNKTEIYVKYKVTDSDTIYEYKIVMED